MSWRVFVGDYDPHPDYVMIDVTLPDFLTARARMLSILEKWRDDECHVCRVDAREAEDDLRTSLTPREWETVIEGDDYVIRQG